MSVVSHKQDSDSTASGLPVRRADLAGLSQDMTNRSIAMGQYRPEARPDLLEGMFRRAQALKEAGSYDEALELLREVPPGADSPLLLEVLMLRAELLSLQGEYQKACEVYASLRVFSANNLNLSIEDRLRLEGLIQLNTAWLLEQQDQIAAAITGYDNAIGALEPLQALMPEQILPALMMAYRQRSRAHRAAGSIAQAAMDLEQSGRLQEQLLLSSSEGEDTALEQVSSWFALGQMQQEVEHWQEAYDSFVMALNLSDDLPAGSERNRWQGMIQTQEARCLEGLGELAHATSLYRAALTLISRQESPLQWVQLQLLQTGLSLRQGRRDALARIGDIETELRALESAGTERHVLAVPLMALANLCFEADSERALEFYGAAIRSLEQSQRLQSEESQRALVDAYRSRAGLLESKGQLPKALASYKQAQRHAEGVLSNKEKAELELRVGLAHQAAGKAEQALQDFARARELAEMNAECDSAWFRAGYFHAFVLATELGRPEDALAELLVLDALAPGHVDYDLACLHARLKQPDQAFERLARHLAGPDPLSLEDILADPDLGVLQADTRWAGMVQGAESR